MYKCDRVEASRVSGRSGRIIYSRAIFCIRFELFHLRYPPLELFVSEDEHSYLDMLEAVSRRTSVGVKQLSSSDYQRNQLGDYTHALTVHHCYGQGQQLT